MATRAEKLIHARLPTAQILVPRFLLNILKYTLLVILSISYLLPLYWMFSSALKTSSQVYTIPPIWVPIPPMWENFPAAWGTYNFNLYLFNTIYRYAIPVTLATVVSSAVVAYGFSRLQWTGRDKLFLICLMTMMIPYQVRAVPLFITFKELDWLNSYRPLTIPAWFGNAYFIFLLRQFFKTIPEELSDAARIDGASELEILYRVILPLARPALAVVALFTFMGCWNDFYGPLIYINDTNLTPLALGIEGLRRTIMSVGGSKEVAYPYLMAVSAVATTPILFLFFFAQRTFIEGISLTGIKG